MTVLDVVMIVIVGFCLIRGIFRGLIKEISSIVGVLAGYYAAYTYYTYPSKILSKWLTDAGYINILSFFIIFCLVFLTISILGVIIKYLLSISFLGWVDRICGAGFGLIKGVLIAAILLVALTAFLPKGPPVVKKSFLAPHVVLISEAMSKVVPKQMKQQFNIKLKELQSIWKNK
ncbi:MAG: CvpA family protein [Deltaproteobacteria bacterium]|jgi:membrane protein required for colicin V production